MNRTLSQFEHEIGMNNDDTEGRSEDSISGKSAAHYFSRDPSIAQLLVSYGITVRDFILVSFLSDQGPLSVNQLARIVSIEPRGIRKSIARLAAAGLIMQDQVSPDAAASPTIRLTSRGQDIAFRIEKHL